MKDKYTRLKALLLAGTIALGGVSLTGCAQYDGNEKIVKMAEDEDQVKTTLGVGEHIVAVPIKNPARDIRQYNYHPGYKPVGISTNDYGYAFGYAHLVYENEYPVECCSTGKDKNGDYLYQDFGTPIGLKYEEPKSVSGVIEYKPGQHIISVPIGKIGDNKTQIDYHDGYDVVGIASGAFAYSFDGTCVLYVNVEPVKCSLTKVEGNKEMYLSFGEPIEVEMTNTLD